MSYPGGPPRGYGRPPASYGGFPRPGNFGRPPAAAAGGYGAPPARGPPVATGAPPPPRAAPAPAPATGPPPAQFHPQQHAQQQPRGYPPQQAQQPRGYPPQQAQQPRGYPPQQARGYPPQQQPARPPAPPMARGGPPMAPGAAPPMAPGAAPPMAPGGAPPMAPGSAPPMAPGSAPPIQPQAAPPQAAAPAPASGGRQQPPMSRYARGAPPPSVGSAPPGTAFPGMGGAGGGAGATATSGPPSSFYTRATPGAALAPPPSGMPGATGMPRGPMSSAPKMYDPSKTGRPLKQRSDPAAVPEGFRAGQWDASSGAAAADNAAVGLMPTAAGGAAATLDPARQCGDEYMQLTTAQIPNTATLTTKSCIPLGVTVQPLAERPGEPSLPLVDFGSAGVVRCGRCRAYIHPFVRFQNGGRQWRCSMCGKANDVPAVYFCPLDDTGTRTDISERPELQRGSVEFVAPAEYMVRPPQAPVYVFVIDVSYNAVASGAVKHAVAAIKHCITKELLPGGERTQVGFVTFDSSVHFYNLKATLSAPQMLVVSDITDLFLPVPDDLLVNLSDSLTVVEALLESLPEMFAGTRIVESCLGPAVEAAYKVMRHIGGKMVVFQSQLPSLGGGRLKHRENPKLLGGESEHTMLNPDTTYYKNLALEFSRQQISVDMFLTPSQYTDVATLSTLARFTAGQVYLYAAFNEACDAERFNADIVHDLTRNTGFESVMRVRATKGLRVTNFHGNFFIRGTDLLALPNVTSDTACTVELDHVEVLNPNSMITIQAALLYTASCGERRICVHTRACTVTTVLAQVFNNVDVDSLCNVLAKLALDRAKRIGFPSARGWIHRKCVDIIRSFRMSTASVYGAAGAQKSPMLPDNLQLLPLFTMGLEKSPLLRGGTDIGTDERSMLFYLMQGMSTSRSRRFIHPCMYAIHKMRAKDGTVLTEADAKAAADAGSKVPKTVGKSRIRTPPGLTLTRGCLTSEGVVLLDDGVQQFLWVGRAAEPKMLNELFGVPSLDGVDVSKLVLTDRGTELSTKVAALVAALREEHPVAPQLRVVRAQTNDMHELHFLWRLIEDDASYPGGKITYQGFLESVNRESVHAPPPAGTMAGGAAGRR